MKVIRIATDRLAVLLSTEEADSLLRFCRSAYATSDRSTTTTQAAVKLLAALRDATQPTRTEQ